MSNFVNSEINEPNQLVAPTIDHLGSNRRPNRLRRAVIFGSALVIVAMAAAGCTSGAVDQANESQSEESEETELAEQVEQVETVLGEEPDFLTVPDGADPDAVGNDQLVFADDEGLSEEVAEAPVLDEDDMVEIDLEQTPEVPQADVAVGEAALCATVQIGRDAVVDGDEATANQQRDLLIERGSRVSDEKLSKTLVKVGDSVDLDREVIEEALARCVELGFER